MAQHLTGAFAARGLAVSYRTGFAEHEDLAGVVLQRYGAIDPTAAEVASGSGQHLGPASQLAARLQAALSFVGARWRDPQLRDRVRASAEAPAAVYATGGRDACEIDGRCAFAFTSTAGRTGPVTVLLPPGHAHAAQQQRRYPVVYLLHGSRQDTADIEAALATLPQLMNSAAESRETRLPKALIVLVDGRCRPGAAGGAECFRETFFTDSPRAGGPQMESWWLELMDDIDTRYRTLAPADAEWTP